VAQGRWRDMVHVFGEAAERLPEPAGRARVESARRFHELLIAECDALIDRWNRLDGADEAAPAARRVSGS
jgi:hypothetical protein